MNNVLEMIYKIRDIVSSENLLTRRVYLKTQLCDVTW